MGRRDANALHGVLVIDKPAGVTSATVVGELRRRLGTDQAGHTGTLDPIATGVLPICLSAATKLAQWLIAEDKTYDATVQLGVDSITKGGKVIVVGLFGGDITISTPFFPLRAMAIQGSYVGSLPEMKELLDLVRAKGLPPIPMTTRPLDQVAGALDDLRAGKVIGRVVLTA